jgi:hypothetical protein
MADDKPLSSEDMIRRAREELDLPLPADHLEVDMEFRRVDRDVDLHNADRSRRIRLRRDQLDNRTGPR